MSLFARSFLLIALLVVTSLIVSLAILRAYQREPLAAELSRQTGSIVNLTRAALINADPEKRLGLLRELSDMEDIRVYAASPGEALEPMPNEPLLNRVAQLVHVMLGERTRFAHHAKRAISPAIAWCSARPRACRNALAPFGLAPMPAARKRSLARCCRLSASSRRLKAIRSSSTAWTSASNAAACAS